MIRSIRNFYYHYIKIKLSNQIILVIAFICLIQIVGVFIMYFYIFSHRKEEIIENNMQVLHQANSNYFSVIIEELSNASRDIFYNKVFWDNQENQEYAIASEDSQIYSILAGKYHSFSSIDSIYLYSSRTEKLYIMDELSFKGIPVQTLGHNSFLSGTQELQSLSWYVDARQQNGGLAISRGKEIRRGTKNLICYSRYLKYPLKNNDYYYLITVNMSRTQLDDLARQLNQAGESLLIYDSDRNQIYDSGGLEAVYQQEIRKYLEGNYAASGWFTLEMNHRPYIVITDTALPEGWTMVKLIPEQTVVGDLQVQFVWNCLLIFAIFLVGTLTLYFVINKTTRPIERLAETMRHYRQGETYGDVRMERRPDEVGVLYTSFAKMNRRINTLIESEYQSQIQEKQAKLEALQAQLDPHFLYNTLQTISGIAIEKNVTEIEQINNSLSRILHYNLNNNKTVVTVAEELKIVNDYMDIQRYRFGERIGLMVELSPDTLGSRVPVFALQLAVENAIKHGLDQMMDRLDIRIYDQTGKERVLMIADNGKGMDDLSLKKLNRILTAGTKRPGGYQQKGLINLNERMRQYFGPAYHIVMENNPKGGLILSMKLPTDEEEGV